MFLCDDLTNCSRATARRRFLAPDVRRLQKLPIEVAEKLVVGGRYHIRPLLPLVEPAQLPSNGPAAAILRY